MVQEAVQEGTQANKGYIIGGTINIIVGFARFGSWVCYSSQSTEIRSRELGVVFFLFFFFRTKRGKGLPGEWKRVEE